MISLAAALSLVLCHGGLGSSDVLLREKAKVNGKITFRLKIEAQLNVLNLRRDNSVILPRRQGSSRTNTEIWVMTIMTEKSFPLFAPTQQQCNGDQQIGRALGGTFISWCYDDETVSCNNKLKDVCGSTGSTGSIFKQLIAFAVGTLHVLHVKAPSRGLYWSVMEILP